VRVRILGAAERDLEEGFHFYERQSPDLGSYFLDSLYSDIDSSPASAEFIAFVSDIIDCPPNGSHSPFIIRLSRIRSWLPPSLTAAGIRVG
jgi:hypothetical protein